MEKGGILLVIVLPMQPNHFRRLHAFDVMLALNLNLFPFLLIKQHFYLEYGIVLRQHRDGIDEFHRLHAIFVHAAPIIVKDFAKMNCKG